jgi:copper resistance protein C
MDERAGINPRLRAVLAALALAGAASAWTPPAAAHAFPEDEQPSVGSVIHEIPKQVSIRFNAKLEPLFSTIVVEDARGDKVSGDSHVDADTQTLLATSFRSHGPGVYHVYWSVVAWDGHHTEGDYIFTIKP